MPTNQLKTRITADASQFNRVVGRLGKTVGRSAVGLAGVGLGAAVFSIREAVGFEKKMAEVFTLLGDPPPDLREKLTNDIRGLSVEFGQAKNELATGLYAALSAGVPVGNVIDFLRTGVKTAVASVTDTETAIKGLVGIINAYRMSSTDAEAISDKLFTTVKLGSTNYALMADSLGKSNSAAKALGVDLDEMLASFIAIVGSEMDTARATTMLGAVMSSLATPTENLTARFKELGVRTAEELVETHGLIGGLRLLTKTSDGSLTAISKLFGEKRAASGILALLAEGRIGDHMAELGNAAGAQGVAFDIMASTTSHSLDRMKQDFMATAEKMGATLLPSVKELAETMQTSLNDPEIQTAIKSFFGGVESSAEAAASTVNFLVERFGELAAFGRAAEDIIMPNTAEDDLGTGGVIDWFRRFRQNKMSGRVAGGDIYGSGPSKLSEKTNAIDIAAGRKAQIMAIRANPQYFADTMTSERLMRLHSWAPALIHEVNTLKANNATMAAERHRLERNAAAAEKTAVILDTRLPANWGQ